MEDPATTAFALNVDLAARLIQAMPAAMLLIDRTGRILLTNRKLDQMFGYAAGELVNLSIETLVPARARARHQSQVDHYFTAPTARGVDGGRELGGLCKSGDEIRIEISLCPIESPEETFTLASIANVTERSRAEAAAMRFASIVENSEDAIISKSLDGVITSWNHGAERLFGYTAEEALGQPIYLIIPERLHADEERIMAQILARQRIDHFETERLRRDGSEVPVSITISPVFNAGGDLVGGAKIARDISVLRQRDEELTRSNAALQEFAYVASHDLQEPLRMVANYTELLAERYRGRLDEKADLYIHHASDGARRMQRLVTDLLAYSRVGSQGRPLLPVDVTVVLRRVTNSLQRLLEDVEGSVTHEELPRVQADEVQLQQLLQNLIGNALKFRRSDPPCVHVAAARENRAWHFTVQDNGIGMDEKYADRVFQMFQRLHAVGTYDGSGIGLSIAKRIVERHGGRIWFESTPGQGTTFHFTLLAVEGSGE